MEQADFWLSCLHAVIAVSELRKFPIRELNLDMDLFSSDIRLFLTARRPLPYFVMKQRTQLRDLGWDIPADEFLRNLGQGKYLDQYVDLISKT